VYAGANCALVALAAALVNYAAPAAAGSGIPEVKVRGKPLTSEAWVSGETAPDERKLDGRLRPGS